MNSPRARRALLASVLMATGAAAFVTVLLLVPRPGLYSRNGRVMNTGFSARALFFESAADRAPFFGRATERAAGALDAAFSEARRVEGLMSRFLPASDISRLCAAPPGTPVRVAPETLRVLSMSGDIHRRSGGAFDVTVGPLVALYKYTGREEKRLPTDAEIAATLEHVGCDKLRLEAGTQTARLDVAGMAVDLSAVAKGFAVDQALEELRAHGAHAGLVEIGGEVRAFGTKPGNKPWRVGIQHPRSGGLMGSLELRDAAMATSGDYRKFFRKGGRRASHIVDPRTGRPLVGGAVSVTVLAPTCALADGLATAISVLGPAEGLKLVQSYRTEGKVVEALIIEETAGGKLVPHASPGLRNLQLDL